MSGVRIDDTSDNKVTMVAVSKQRQNETGNARTNNYNNQRYNKPQDKKEEEGERQMNLKQPSAPTAVSSETRMYHKNASGWTSKIDIAKYPANQYSRTIASLGSY